MLSLVDTHQYYQVFLAQAVGMGIGGGLIYVPTITVQSHYWLKHRPFALGVIFTGTCFFCYLSQIELTSASIGISFGGLVYPIMLNQMLEHGISFAWTVRASAFVVLGLLAVANCTLIPRKDLSGSYHGSPADSDRMPGFWSILLDLPFMLANIA
jgi:MFS family permease